MPAAYPENQLVKIPRSNLGYELPRGYRVPERTGSEYIDQLLRQLYLQIGPSSDSIVIGVASPDRNQGVTTTATNLAIRSADYLISPTLLIDANLQDPKITRHFRCKGPGLSECLSAELTLDKCVHRTKVKGLSVLGLGDRHSARSVGLHPELVAEVRNDYRFSVIDLPTLTGPSQLDTFVPQLNGILLVASYGTKASKLKELKNRIVSDGGEVLGVIMTGNETSIPRWLRRFF